jgi:hypothetical protein
VQVAGDANPLLADGQPARSIVHLALIRGRADFARNDFDERQHLDRRAIEAAKEHAARQPLCFERRGRDVRSGENSPRRP